MFFPALLVGGLWANLYSSRELDEVSTLERSRRPLNDFWSGVLLGAILGIWAGVNCSESLKNAFSSLDKVATWLMPSSDKRPPDSTSGQLPPTAQYQTVPPGGGQPQVVFYPSSQQQ
eukprot:TRINITY_DN37404_c0_g1_i1.p1 TRINITY_DN37404_c0_g1~~TRINITY_DN37404_c0_g1_i1.p1  ORF type:complete len:117 (+),score=19.75 TRINITY_DN37404_c0_g1_i1:40-390(+)